MAATFGEGIAAATTRVDLEARSERQLNWAILRRFFR
jgi:hypothetical protein